jgi:hypothetical protein
MELGPKNWFFNALGPIEVTEAFWLPTQGSHMLKFVKGLYYSKRVPEFLSSHLNCPPPPLVGEGLGGPTLDDWTETLVLYII